MHPLGIPWKKTEQDKKLEVTCGQCVWSRIAGPGPKVLRCIASGNRRVEDNWYGCINYENELACLECAACCGPAFDVVEVSPKDPVRKKQPDWINKTHGRYHIVRTKSNYCSALQKDNKCVIYNDRPRCCRDFIKGSANCIFARRRVGLSKKWKIC